MGVLRWENSIRRDEAYIYMVKVGWCWECCGIQSVELMGYREKVIMIRSLRSKWRFMEKGKSKHDERFNHLMELYLLWFWIWHPPATTTTNNTIRYMHYTCGEREREGIWSLDKNWRIISAERKSFLFCIISQMGKSILDWLQVVFWLELSQKVQTSQVT